MIPIGFRFCVLQNTHSSCRLINDFLLVSFCIFGIWFLNLKPSHISYFNPARSASERMKEAVMKLAFQWGSLLNPDRNYRNTLNILATETPLIFVPNCERASVG